MKKLNLLLIVSMIAVALLAANPPGKLVRLEVINGSGDTVYMRLNGRGTGAFYYLTIPADQDKTFTVLVDSYKRTTWTCGGIVSSGSLNMTGNVKLKFVLCGKIPLRTVLIDQGDDGSMDCWYYFYMFPDGSFLFDKYCDGIYRFPNFGEPTQEKVVSFNAYSNFMWVKDPTFTFHQQWAWGKNLSLWIKVKLPYAVWTSYKSPRGIFMRYRY